jgi:hypothetical protein
LQTARAQPAHPGELAEIVGTVRLREQHRKQLRPSPPEEQFGENATFRKFDEILSRFHFLAHSIQFLYQLYQIQEQ